MFGRSLRCVVLLCAITSFLMPAALAQSGTCSPQRVESFRVEVDADRPAVRVGDDISLTIKVWRSVIGRDLHPAKDASVMANVRVGRVAQGAAGVTVENGVATVQLRTARNLGPGSADVSVLATSSPVHCVEEFGHVTERGLFKIIR